jgi:hypothetical protein
MEKEKENSFLSKHTNDSSVKKKIKIKRERLKTCTEK